MVRRREPNLDTVGGRIQAARLTKGLTQDQLAARIGVSKGAVSQWEAGGIKNLTAMNLLRFCEVTEVSARWILIGKEKDGTPVPMGRPVYLEPDESDLIATFRVLDNAHQDTLVKVAHQYLLLAASQHPTRTNPYPKPPKVKK